MRGYRFQLIVSVIFLLLNFGLHAQTEFYFKQVSLKEGLSHPTVTDILYDTKGDIWIGTKSGLNRFDKHEIKTYFSDLDMSGSLPGNQIILLIEDSLNNLWVGTNGGLALYDRVTDSFQPIIFNGKEIHVSTAMLLEDGVVFGGYNLYKYSYATRQFTEITYERKLKGYITFLHQWQEGRWLMGTRRDGLGVYDPQTGVVDRTFVKEKNISAYYVDSNGCLWVSPYGAGLLCYSAGGKLLREYRSDNSQLTNDIVRDIIEKDGNMWFATDGGGICILDRTTGQINSIQHISGDMTSIPANSINCLYLDRENNPWAGTVREGLLYIRDVYMKTYCGVTRESPYGLSESAVICLYEDADRTLWIGTDGGGLNSKKIGDKRFEHYSFPLADKVTSITGFSDHELLLSTFGEGLYVFDTRRHTFKPFLLVNKSVNDRTCRTGLNIYLHQVNPHKIYIFADSIYSYDLSTKRFSHIQYNIPKDKPVAFNSLTRFESNEDKTWLFNVNNIFELDHAEDSLTPVYYADESTTINSVSRDPQGRFWLGTNKGLVCYTPASGKSQVVETSLFHEISAIILDSHNRLWIGAQGMLFTYVVDENKFIVWGESDGVLLNDYFSEALLETRAGNVYMGGSSGLLYIHGDIRFENDLQPSFGISAVLLDGSPFPNIGTSIPAKLSIPWNHTSLAIKIQVTENDIFRKKVFRYHISGPDNSYDIETYDYTFTIHTIAEGKYTITVCCNLQNGNWSEPVRLIDLEVTPPWWENRWFIYSLLLLLFISIITVSVYAIRRKENRLKWKMKEHEEEVNKEKIRFLINISHELRTPLTLVYAPLKRLLQNKNFDDETFKQLTGIYKQTKQMRNIINMVLDARKMEVGKDKLYLQQHAFNEWVRNIVEDFRNEFENKGIEIQYDLNEEVRTVVFDANKCEIVLSNLLMNALKFSDENTVVLIQTMLDNGFARVLIKDQGIGIDETAQTQLFTRFSQGTHGLQGSGIGLSYAKILIEMHHGHIGAYNNPDKGATFYFELPLSADEQVVNCQKKNYLNELVDFPKESLPTDDGRVFSLSNYMVLIVEDEKDLRYFLVDALSPYFSKVYSAVNGAEALSIARNYQPDIIVSDVMMPQVDGFTLCQSIKSDDSLSHIPVILLTARIDQESANLGYKLGADAYLPKPFDVETLMNLIRNQLRIREQIKQRYKDNAGILLPEEAVFSNADEDFMLRMNKYIRENLSDKNLDVKFLVNKMNVSRSALYNKVKQLKGMGVNDYINKFRIETAIQLLEHSDMSILEISEKVGFSNQSYFSITFKQATGLSPSKYKEQFKKGNV